VAVAVSPHLVASEATDVAAAVAAVAAAAAAESPSPSPFVLGIDSTTLTGRLHASQLSRSSSL
jgi:hypothetical protein